MSDGRLMPRRWADCGVVGVCEFGETVTDRPLRIASTTRSSTFVDLLGELDGVVFCSAHRVVPRQRTQSLPGGEYVIEAAELLLIASDMGRRGEGLVRGHGGRRKGLTVASNSLARTLCAHRQRHRPASRGLAEKIPQVRISERRGGSNGVRLAPCRGQLVTAATGYAGPAVARSKGYDGNAFE